MQIENNIINNKDRILNWNYGSDTTVISNNNIINLCKNIVQAFSQTLYIQQLDFVDIQNKAVLKSLIETMQHETWVLNLISTFKKKVLKGEVTYNEGFRKPILNILQTYENIGDKQLLDLIHSNKTISISSWHQKNAMFDHELDQYQKDQIANASRVDFIYKSALKANRIRSEKNQIHKAYIQQYFFAFQYDGMYFSTGTNITFIDYKDKPPCTSGKYNFDARCREYFIAAKNSIFIAGFPPIMFDGGFENKPYVACGFCKKIFYPQFQQEQYQALFQNQKQDLYSIVCNSVYMQEIKFVFEKVGIQDCLRILVDPITMRLVYQSDYQMKRDEIVTIYDTYLNRFNDKEQLDFFVEKIKSLYKQKMIKECSYDRDHIFKFAEDDKKEEFFFYQGGIEMVGLFGISYTVDRNIIELPNGKKLMEFCYTSNLLFLSIMSTNQLKFQAIILDENITKVDIIFRSSVYFTIFVCVFVSIFYTFRISNMLNNPLQHLTNILKKLKVDEETKNYILFEDGMLTGDFQIDCSELFLSSDTLFLYESFQNLFQTLIYTTSLIYDQDECYSLIQLNKQIEYFKFLRNYRALGICYNNIGNIHFNNNRYFEAIENYQMSIIQCNYELNQYEEKTNENIQIIESKEIKQPDVDNQTINNMNREIFEIKQPDVDNQINNNMDKEIFEIKQPDVDNQTYNNMDREIFDFKQQNQQIKKFKCYGIFEKIKQFLKNLSLFKYFKKPEQEFQQNILMECLQQYGMQTDLKQIQNQTEIYSMLFNRKFNCFKAVFSLMMTSRNSLSNWDIATTLITELKDISKVKLPSSNKREVIINQHALGILQQINEIQESKNILEENECLLKSIKEQEIQNNKRNSNQFNLKRISISKHNSVSTQQQQAPNTPFSTRQSQSPTRIHLYSASSAQKQSLPSINTVINQNQSNMQQSQKLKFLNRKSVGFSPTENPQYISNSPYPVRKTQSNLYFKFILTKNTNPNGNQYFDDTINHDYIEQQSPLQNGLLNQNEDSFSALNPNYFPSLQKTQSNLIVSFKDESPLKKKQSSSPFMMRSISNLQSSPQTHISKHVYDWVNDKQKKNKKVKQQKYDEDDSNLSRKDRHSFMNNIKDHLNPINSEYSARSKKSRVTLSERHKSSSKLFVQYDQDDIYEYSNEALDGIILEQISTYQTMIQNYSQAAEVLTKYFEESKAILPYISYKCFLKLFGIFEKFNLTHPQLEQIFQMSNTNISFKINVVYFSWASEQSFSEQNNIETSFFSYKPQVKFLNQEMNSELRQQKMKIMNLCQVIIEQIMNNSDDYFGLITSDLEDMSIKENISMINKDIINKNIDLIKKELYKNFDPPPIVIRQVQKTEEFCETPSPIRKHSRSLQLDKKVYSPFKKYTSKKRQLFTFDKLNKNSPKSLNSFSSCQNFSEKRQSFKNELQNKTHKKAIALQNMLIENDKYNKKIQNGFQEPQMLRSQNKSILKSQASPDILLNNTKQNLLHDKQTSNSFTASQSQINEIQFKTNNNITYNFNNVTHLQTYDYNINNNLTDYHNQSSYNMNRSGYGKSFLNTINQEKHIEFGESPKSFNQITNGNYSPKTQTNAILVSQNSINQKDQNIQFIENLDESIKVPEKEYIQYNQCSTILKDYSNKSNTFQDLIKLQRLKLDSKIDLNIKEQNKNDQLTFTKYLHQYKLNNQLSMSNSASMLEQKLEKIPKSEKKQFLPIKQIQPNDQENNAASIIDIQNQINLKKRKLFYFTIRKSLQQVTCQYDNKSLLLLLSKYQFQQKNNQNKSHQNDKTNYDSLKKLFLQNAQPLHQQNIKFFKKFIIAVIDDLKMIDQDSKEFLLLAQNLKILEVELCILCLNESLSLNENAKYTTKIIDDKYVISYFYCEQNLLLYLLNSRFKKHYSCIPLIVEHF